MASSCPAESWSPGLDRRGGEREHERGLRCGDDQKQGVKFNDDYASKGYDYDGIARDCVGVIPLDDHGWTHPAAAEDALEIYQTRSNSRDHVITHA